MNANMNKTVNLQCLSLFILLASLVKTIDHTMLIFPVYRSNQLGEIRIEIAQGSTAEYLKQDKEMYFESFDQEILYPGKLLSSKAPVGDEKLVLELSVAQTRRMLIVFNNFNPIDPQSLDSDNMDNNLPVNKDVKSLPSIFIDNSKIRDQLKGGKLFKNRVFSLRENLRKLSNLNSANYITVISFSGFTFLFTSKNKLNDYAITFILRKKLFELFTATEQMDDYDKSIDAINQVLEYTYKDIQEYEELEAESKRKLLEDFNEEHTKKFISEYEFGEQQFEEGYVIYQEVLKVDDKIDEVTKNIEKIIAKMLKDGKKSESMMIDINRKEEDKRDLKTNKKILLAKISKKTREQLDIINEYYEEKFDQYLQDTGNQRARVEYRFEKIMKHMQTYESKEKELNEKCRFVFDTLDENFWIEDVDIQLFIDDFHRMPTEELEDEGDLEESMQLDVQSQDSQGARNNVGFENEDMIIGQHEIL